MLAENTMFWLSGATERPMCQAMHCRRAIGYLKKYQTRRWLE